MSDAHGLFAELEATLTNGAGQHRFTILRKITDLFLSEADTYTDEHVALFDELMSRLIDRIERQALIELSGRLAPAARAPARVIGALSNDDDIEIAGPVLEQSGLLSDDDLVAIAQTRSQAHLAAIAGRARISATVTDVLIDRGDSQVAHRVVANPGARFSRLGFGKAVSRAESDETLAVTVASRLDLPDDLLEQLVGKASTAVRHRLLAKAPPEMEARIGQALVVASQRVVLSELSATEAAAPSRRNNPGRLRARVAECAETRNLPELFEALSLLSELPINAIKDMVRQRSDEGILVLGKSCELGWHDLQKVMAAIVPSNRTPEEINALFASYTALTPEIAHRAVGFIKTSRTKLTAEFRKLAAAGAT
jgi:uncharacterized protein (DUF2336 family)